MVIHARSRLLPGPPKRKWGISESEDECQEMATSRVVLNPPSTRLMRRLSETAFVTNGRSRKSSHMRAVPASRHQTTAWRPRWMMRSCSSWSRGWRGSSMVTRPAAVVLWNLVVVVTGRTCGRSRRQVVGRTCWKRVIVTVSCRPKGSWDQRKQASLAQCWASRTVRTLLACRILSSKFCRRSACRS